MSVNPELRSLEIEIPSQPEVLVRLSVLMAEEDIDIAAISALVESDMALAAAVLKAVNSSLYGLRGRVQTVHQALTYLGMREVSGIAFEMSLRAAFPPAAELEPVWERAGRRGLVMGRIAQLLQGVDPWACHSAGLFEECGKAVLYRHAPQHYPAMLRAASTDRELVGLETRAFGVGHDALGAALCESWGLAAAAVSSVRHHVGVQEDLKLTAPLGPLAPVVVVSAVAQAVMAAPARLETVVAALAPQAELDAVPLLRAAHRVAEQLENAGA